MILYCVRHGSTVWTDETRYSGTSNPPLSPRGEAEAQAMADYLRDAAFNLAVTSPLARCRRTAEIIASTATLPGTWQSDPRAQEIYYGAWEGRTRDEILRHDPDAFVAWDNDPTKRAPPGGETVASVATRVTALLSEWLAAGHGRVLLVSHRTVLRILVAQALGLPLAEYRKRLDHGPAALTVLDLTAPNAGKLLLYNFAPGKSAGSI